MKPQVRKRDGQWQSNSNGCNGWADGWISWSTYELACIDANRCARHSTRAAISTSAWK